MNNAVAQKNTEVEIADNVTKPTRTLANEAPTIKPVPAQKASAVGAKKRLSASERESSVNDSYSPKKHDKQEKPASASSIARPAKPYIPRELIVKYKPGVKEDVKTAVRTSVKAQVRKRFENQGMEHWKLPPGTTVSEAIKKLGSNPAVEYVEPNYKRYPRAIPNDPAFFQQWAMQNIGQLIHDPVGAVAGTPGADMKLVKAWDMTTGSKNVVVAVVDDSVEYDHPDLAANIWTNPGEIAGDGIDNDGNGFVDDVYGWDFRDNDNDPRGVPNQDGHGTAVAGCIGAVGNNGLGVTGVNWNVSIMPIRIAFDSASIIAAFDYAIANGARIINASFGGPYFSQAEFDAVKRLEAAGILLVAAAGNDEINNDQVFDSPSGFDVANVLAVAGSDPYGKMITWSQYGTTSVDVAAPGINVYTTMLPSGISMGNSGANGVSYDYILGTSFSSPYVAGIAALIKSRYPQAGFQELKGRIMAAASLPGNQIQTTRKGLLATNGLADAYASLTIAPQPVLVIRKVRVDDAASGNNNGQLDPGESVSLWVDLENTWQSASNVSATLSSADATVTITNPTASYPAIASGANAQSSTPFSVTLNSSVAAHARIPFTLNISAGAYSVTRYFELEVGNLDLGGSLLQATIQQDAQDDFHYYHISIPAGTQKLTLRTFSSADVDLIAKAGSLPQYSMSGWPQPADAGTLVASTASGNEQIVIPNPTAGIYHVVVYNYDHTAANTSYEIQAVVSGQPVTATDFDGDGVMDGADAFPTDPAASVDADGDGVPDAWNAGMSAADSTTGLTVIDSAPQEFTCWTAGCAEAGQVWHGITLPSSLSSVTFNDVVWNGSQAVAVGDGGT
ncbi:hypothetical protein D6833_03575, partial [Candidatus Parcubacteria bacterium]